MDSHAALDWILIVTCLVMLYNQHTHLECSATEQHMRSDVDSIMLVSEQYSAVKPQASGRAKASVQACMSAIPCGSARGQSLTTQAFHPLAVRQK